MKALIISVRQKNGTK